MTMRRVALLFVALLPAAAEQSPLDRVWVRSRVMGGEAQHLAPDVQEVQSGADEVRVRSAGLSWQSFGPLQAGRDDTQGVRRFDFAFPRRPQRQAGGSTKPAGVAGAFINGVPIYDPAGGPSYRDQNIWHADVVAQADDGSWTVSGRPAASGHPRQTPALLQLLLAGRTVHSPLIGYALDGFPIYGPYGWNQKGEVVAFRSSYRFRDIRERHSLPDGTALPPGQEGPPVSGAFPLGVFVEDYECLEGSGDLDCHNGRFAVTPQYPQGTYAYFAATDPRGKLAYPYLIGHNYAGTYEAAPAPPHTVARQAGVTLRASTPRPRAGESVTWDFQLEGAGVERVHEKPLHLLVVSQDLARLDHVHPYPLTPKRFKLQYTFAAGGRYWLYVDHTPIGGVPTIARFDMVVEGPPGQLPSQVENREAVAGGVRATLTGAAPLAANRDIEFLFQLTDAGTGAPLQNLEPYLGAWGHILLMSADGADFVHAHPKEEQTASPDPWQHAHGAAGPSPSRIETAAGFNRAGIYKMWLQVQRAGQVLTFPFLLRVGEGEPSRPRGAVPAGAIPVTVSASGYSPGRIQAVPGKPVRLAFTRTDARNCGRRVVFPRLGIDVELPPGETTLIELPPQEAGEYGFTCGMGMYRGALLVAPTAAPAASETLTPPRGPGGVPRPPGS